MTKALIPAIFLCAAAPLARAAGQPAAPLPFLHARGTAIVDDHNRPVILRGCNLGSWLLLEMWMMGLDRPGDPTDQWQLEQLLTQRFGAADAGALLDLYRENWIQPRDFRIIKQWGFNTVRLPFDSALLEDGTAPGTLRPDAFKWLDRAQQMAADAGIYIILDMHGAPGGQSIDACTGRAGQNRLWLPENRRRAAALWKQIAAHFATSPVIAGYDLLNEPFGNNNSEDDDDALTGTVGELIKAIREVDAAHLIFCPGSKRGIEFYGSPASHGWRNVGFTEHFYAGLFGMGEPTLETHTAVLSRDFENRASLLNAWQAPFLMGEFNVVWGPAGGPAMMRRYFDTAASHGWAATLWCYKMVKAGPGAHPNAWYMLTNLDPVDIPDFNTAPRAAIAEFFKEIGTMEYAQEDELRAALTAPSPPGMVLHQYPRLRSPPPQTQPAGMDAMDVGDAYPRGGQQMPKSGVLDVYGGGRDVYEGRDEFHFVSRAAAGTFQASATTAPPEPTSRYAKAGLMFRSATSADSPLAMVSLTPDGECKFAFRRNAGERIDEEVLAGPGETRTLWLGRNGPDFEARALDGDGRVIGSRTATLPELAAPGRLGVFVCSHNVFALSKASFTGIKIDTHQENEN
jgi:glucan 1,3-beta-glucosidase